MLDNEANLNLGYTVSPFGGESRHSTKSRSIYMQMLKSLQHLILNLNEENIELTVQQTMDLYRPKYPYSFNRILSILIYYSFISQREEGDTYLKFIKLIQKKEEEINENDPKIIEVFSSYLNDIQFSQECEYFLEKMIEQNLIEKNIIKKNRSKYFAHYKTEEENKELYDDFFSYIFIQQYDKLSKNDWELHKKYIKEAVNTSEISKIIRNDDLDKLQEISSQAEFDFNQKIKPSLYERFSFINAENVSLIDFAAFFSSVKCFKYLLMNGAKVNNTAKHATAGGNLEIIHLCEQNHSSFEKSYETAIEFHRNDIFKYIYKNKIENLDKNVQNSTFYNIDQNILRLVPPKSDELKSKYLKKLLKYSDREGNYEIFLYLIKEIKIDFKFINMLARNGNLFLVKHFLKEYPIPKNILVPSVSSGNIELVKYVLKHEGIDINAKKDRHTALMMAVYNDDEILKLLLEQEEINVNAKDDFNGETALMLASEIGNVNGIKLLLKNEDININQKNDFGETALTIAIVRNQTNVVKLLLEQEDIDINIEDDDGKTPLIFASMNNNAEIIKLLLDKEGIDINAKDGHERTALIYASERSNKKIVQLLLEKEGIDINAKDWKEQTALIVAANNDQIEIVELLLEQKEIDVNAKDFNGFTALMLAFQNGNTKIVKLFEQKGIKISSKDDNINDLD